MTDDLRRDLCLVLAFGFAAVVAQLEAMSNAGTDFWLLPLAALGLVILTDFLAGFLADFFGDEVEGDESTRTEQTVSN